MSHDTFRELMALRLYGELDGPEREHLERHLEACADCRRFASELASGLGALSSAPVKRGALRSAPVERVADEIPADWRERLRRSTVDEPQRMRISPWLSSAAAFAAGLLAASLFMRSASERPIDLVARNDGTRAPSIYERFNGSTPPPQATAGGQLALLADYRKH